MTAETDAKQKMQRRPPLYPPDSASPIQSSDGAAPSTRREPSQWAWVGLYLVLAIAVPLTYVLVTHHAWEDYFITFRFSRNLVEGNGLVFNPGERVQGFTSAINVMLPALFYWITGQHGWETTLNLYRGVSLIAFVFGGLVTLRLMLADRGSDRLSPLLFILLFVTDVKTVGFTMNGQECGFMVAFLSLGFMSMYRGASRYWPVAALAFAGLLYTRPDTPVFIAGLAMTGWLFRIEKNRDVLIGLCKAVVLAGLIYLPWFIAMWIYYGQPIPHTIIAKSSFTVGDALNPIGVLKNVLGNYWRIGGYIFEPTYSALGGWPRWLLDPFGFVCLLVASCAWMSRRIDRMTRMASAMFVAATLYLCLISVGAFAYPWYMPSAAVFSTIVLARAIGELLRTLRLSPRASLIVSRALQACIFAIFLTLFIQATRQIRVQQAEIEDNQRMKIGLWLHDHMKPDETAYMEPIGYIGYFSQRHILDWPGLVTPEVVRLRREKLPTTSNPVMLQFAIVPDLMPDWIVMRPSELNRLATIEGVRDRYENVAIFDARERLAGYARLPGIDYLNFDSVFVIIHRRDSDRLRTGK